MAARLVLAFLCIHLASCCDLREISYDDLKKEGGGNLVIKLKAPVIVRQGLWKNAVKFSNESFLREFGHHEIPCSRNVATQSLTGSPSEAVRMSIRAWNEQRAREGGIGYFFHWLTGSLELDQKLAKLYPMPPYLRSYGLQRFLTLGAGSRGIPMHAHHLSWTGLLSGQKHWWILPPNSPMAESRQTTFFEPGEKGSGDLLHCIQEAGDIVLVPEDWWHATYDSADWTLGIGSQASMRNPWKEYSISIGDLRPIEACEEKCDNITEVVVLAGNVKGLELLLEKPSASDILSETPVLHWATFAGHLDVVNFLLEKKADPHAVFDPYGVNETALEVAVSEGKTNVLDVLLQQGVNGDGASRGMSVAAYQGHLEVTEMLLAAKASVEGPDNASMSPLFEAIHGGHSLIVQNLLKHGARIDGLRKVLQDHDKVKDKKGEDQDENDVKEL